MLIKYSKYLLFFFLFAIVLCCGKENKTKSPDCSEHFNNANQYLQKYLYTSNDSLDLIKSLELFDKAIKCDTTIVSYYQGSLTANYLLGRYNKAIDLLDKMYQLSNGRDTKMLVSKGLIFEKIGLRDSANYMFDFASKVLESKLKQQPADSIRIICDKLYLIAVTKGKETSLQVLEQHLLKNPANEKLLIFKSYLQTFDKERILFNRKR